MTNPWLEKLVGYGQGRLAPAQERQLRQLNWSLIALVVALLAWSTIQVAYRAWPLMFWQLALAACGVVLWLLLRLTLRANLLAHLTCLLLVLTLSVSAYYSGGFTGPNLALFLVVPVGAVTVAGAAGLWWALLAAIVVCGLALLAGADYHFPYLVPVSNRELDGFMSWLTAVAVVSFLIWRYDMIRERAERESLETLSQAELASQVRSRFLAGVGKDLQLPALSLVSMVGKLCEDPEAHRQDRWLDEARAASRLLTALVDNVLDLARSEGTPSAHRVVVFAPRQLCRQVLEAFATVPNWEGSMQTRLEVDERLPERLAGDETALRRLLLNLLFDLAERGSRGDEIVLRLGMSDRDDARVGLWVRLEAHNAESSSPGGGRRRPDVSQPEIAASVARQLADWMGATVERFATSSSRGYDLLVKFAIAGSKAFPAQALDGGSRPAPRAERFQVLLAEDNPISRQLAHQLLEKLGCQVVEAQDGHQAVQLAASSDVDLVLMDIGMPGLDGCQATQRIRALESRRRAQVPIVAVTAHDNQQQRRRCLEVGMNDFLPKPFGFEELRRLLHKFRSAG